MLLNYEPSSELATAVENAHTPACPREQRVLSRLLVPVDPSFRAHSERLKFPVRRHKFNEDSLSGRAERRASSSLLRHISLA